jgi:hypothetical protein
VDIVAKVSLILRTDSKKCFWNGLKPTMISSASLVKRFIHMGRKNSYTWDAKTDGSRVQNAIIELKNTIAIRRSVVSFKQGGSVQESAKE